MAVQKNFAENFNYDIIICLNQSLVLVDIVGARTYCEDCIGAVQWTTYDGEGPAYMLWSWDFMFGGCWDPKRPRVVKSGFQNCEPEYHFQWWILHPIQQVKFFLNEAFYKLTCYKKFLTQDWGKENYEKIEASFDHVLDWLLHQENKWWTNNQVDYKNVPSYEASCIKGRNIRRTLYLKLKKLINDFENVLNKEPGQHFDIMRTNHLSIPDVSPGLVTYCRKHHLVKLD